MSDDTEIDALSKAWRTVTDEPVLSVPTALRRRRRQRMVFAIEMLGGSLALASGSFFWLAGESLVLRVSAVVMVVAGVVSIIVAVRTRVGLGGWADWTPRGVLAFRLRECEAALLTARYGLISIAVLIAFAAFVWLAGEFGLDPLAATFHRFYATFVAITGLMGGVWSAWRIRSKGREQLRLRALLEELADD